MEDVDKTLPLLSPVKYHALKQVGESISYQAYDAGHMLGSSSVALEAGGIRLTLSGDVGRSNLPILRDPEALPPADYLIMESTYGDRLHKDEGMVADRLADIVNRTAARGGKIIVPAFAVGRTQQLVLVLHQLTNERRIPQIPIFVDSPLAVSATEAFRKNTGLFRQRSQRLSGEWRRRLRFQAPHLHPRRQRVEEAQRSAWPVHRDLRLRHVRSRTHSAPPAQQH